MMTIEELVKQLRRLDYKTDLDEAAADALERQAKWLEGFVKHSDEMAIALSSEATRGEHLFVENSQLRARIAELEEREADALRGATILAVSLAEKHWPENTDWRPLDETAGVITQINNMCAGLGARIAELEAVHTKKQEWLWAEEITRLREENARLRSILATKMRPPFDDDLAGEPYAAKDRQPEPGGLGRVGQVEGGGEDGGA
jgi:regulator of replication initiation timing